MRKVSIWIVFLFVASIAYSQQPDKSISLGCTDDLGIRWSGWVRCEILNNFMLDTIISELTLYRDTLVETIANISNRNVKQTLTRMVGRLDILIVYFEEFIPTIESSARLSINLTNSSAPLEF